MFDATDYNDFFRAMNDAEVALTGVLGDDLTENDKDDIDNALCRLADARRAVADVLDRQRARHEGDR